MMARRAVAVACAVVLCATRAGAQERLPSLELREDTPQRYRTTTVWYNRDGEGTATAKYVMNARYTRGLEGGTVRWNDVRIAVFDDPQGENADTLAADSMEDFSYKSPEGVADPTLFARLPSDETRHLLRTLVWDAVAVEAFAWTWFDDLELNRTYRPSEFEDFDVSLSGWGMLKMRDLRLRWVGESTVNGEKCAVINYESLANPVRSPGMNGRSLYWGTIMVSLEDKQIERGTLNEDILFDRPPPKGVLNIQREFTMVKDGGE
jgi:hypothetical protein